jgi:hypothetical protein
MGDHLLLSLVHQLALPPEFRIALPRVQPLAVSRASESTSPDVDASARTVARPSHAIEEGMLPDLCTGLWRLRRRMIDPETDRPLEEMRKPFRHLESVWDTLADAGVDIRDHTNEPVPEYGSLGLSVLAYQPMPGFERERVIETVKPSVYVGGRLLQMGQVIVGTPEKPSGAAFEGERT